MGQTYRERRESGRKPSFLWFEPETWEAIARLVTSWNLKVPRDVIARAVNEADKRERRRERIARQK